MLLLEEKGGESGGTGLGEEGIKLFAYPLLLERPVLP